MKHIRSGRAILLLVSLALAVALAAAAAAPPVLLQHRGIQDPAYQTTAYFLLVPEGGRLDGSVSFLPAPSLARTTVIAARNVADTRGVYLLTGEATYTYGTGPVWEMFLNSPSFQGTYNGMHVAPPAAAADYLRQSVLPVLRRQHPDYAIHDIRPDSEAAEQVRRLDAASPHGQAILQVGGRYQYDAIRFRGRCTVGGQAVEADGSLILTCLMQSSDGMNTSYLWGVTGLSILYAEAGRLAALTPLLRSVARSVRMNPAWYTRMQSHRYRLWQKALDAQAEIGEIITRNNERLRDRDRIYAGFSEYLRGTDVYRDPHSGNYFELESGRDHVWFNRNGDVIYSDNPNYSPNTDPRFNTQDWSEGRRAR